jgi:hypothetical protein
LPSGRTVRGPLSLVWAGSTGATAPGITIPAAVIAGLVAATFSHILILKAVAPASFIKARVVALFGDVALLLRLLRITTLVTRGSATARDEVPIIPSTTAETASAKATGSSAESSARTGSRLEAHRSWRGPGKDAAVHLLQQDDLQLLLVQELLAR